MDFSNLKLKFIEYYSPINPSDSDNITNISSLKFFNFFIEKPTLKFNPFKALSNIKLAQIRELIAGYLIILLSNLDFYLTSFILFDLHFDFSVNLKVCSLVVTLGVIGRLIGTLIANYLITKVKKRLLIFVLNLLLVAFYVISSKLISFVGFLILRALISLLFGIYSEIGVLLITSSTNKSNAYIFSNLDILAGPLSYIIIPTYIYVLKNQFNWRQYYQLAAFLIFFCFLFIIFGIEKKFNQRTPKLKKISKKKECYCRAHGALIYTSFLSFGWNLIIRSIVDLYPTLLRMKPDITYNQFILGTCMAGFGALAGGLTLGIIAPFIGYQRSLLLALITVLSTFLIYSYVSLTPIQLMLTMLFIQLFIQFGFSSLYYHLAKNFHPNHRGGFPRAGAYIGILFSSFALQLELVIGEALGNYEKGELYYELVQFWIIIASVVILAVCCIVSGWNVYPELSFLGSIANDEDHEHEDHTFVHSEEINTEKDTQLASTKQDMGNVQLLTINNTELPSTSSNMLGLDFL
jgi:MFS family permease